MTFEVDVRRLPGLTTLVLRVSNDDDACATYVEKYSDIASTGTLLAYLQPYHEKIVEAVGHFLRHGLGIHAAHLAEALVVAVEYYTVTDAKAAARADAARSDAVDPDLLVLRADPLDPPVALFTDVARPTDVLTAPPSHGGEERDPVNFLREPFSLGRTLRELVWELTSLATRLGWCDRPVDVFAELVRPVMGDWPALLRFADVVTNVGRACSMINQNLVENEINVREVWKGEASDACQAHVRLFGRSHLETQQWVDQIAGCYRQAGTGVCALNQKLGDALVRLTDLALAALAAAEAAEASVVTVIGPVVFGGGAAYEFYQFWQALQTGRELAEATDLLVHGFAEQLFHLASLSHDSARPSLPPALGLPEPRRGG